MRYHKHAIATAIGAGLLIAPIAQSASAAPVSTAKHYSSCAKVQKVYPGGVAKNRTVTNTKTVGGKKVLAASRLQPKVSAKLYNANKGLDRDKDGIACEV